MLARLTVVCLLITIQSGLAQSPDKVTISDEVDAGKERKTDSIVERYPSGKVKIERHVAKDDQQNYVQHGAFRMYSESGQVIAEGNYDENRRTGVWNRWYQRGEVKLLRNAPFNQFQAPYISQATFKNGQLDGYWIIFDARHNKISQILFKDGEREGVATWWHANGVKAQEFTYKAGAINGAAKKWNPQGALVSHEMYTDGRRLSTRTEVNRQGKKIRQGSYLEAALVLAEHDDWWEGKVAKYSPTGDSIRHGKWKTFYPSGNVASTGHFDMGAESGPFVWYHENGQKKIEGTYVDGKQTGKWLWWHKNAQPKIEGSYDQGNPTNSWVWWSDKGAVTQRAEFGNANQLETEVEKKDIASSRRKKGEPTEAVGVEKGPKLRSAKKEPPLLPIR